MFGLFKQQINHEYISLDEVERRLDAGSRFSKKIYPMKVLK